MKKSIIKLSILTIVLMIISVVFILINGKEYTVSFNLNGIDDYDVEVVNDTGEIAIIEENIINDKYIAKIKAVKPGRIFMNMNQNDYGEGKILYVHKNMVITDNNFFGKSTGSEIIPISLSIILIYILYLLIRKYVDSMHKNIYQYRNVSYLGIIIFICSFLISTILSVFNYQGLYETINTTIGSMSALSLILFPIAVVTFVLVTISNIKLIIKEGKSFKNLLGLFLGIFICLSTLLPDYIYGMLQKSQTINVFNLNSIGPYLYNFVESLVYLGVVYLECLLISTIVVGIISATRRIKYNKDYVIILGCQIRKDGTLTPLLRGRVDRAIKFRNKQLEKTGKDLIFIPSGGKGRYEIISEADAMKNYLISKGIKEENILVENKSKNTYENIKFSNKLIKDKNANVAFSTTNYHVFRAGLLATEQGLLIEGMGSNTKPYFWINAFIREFIGTLNSEKKKHIIMLILIILILILMISITYFANNI